MLFNYLNNVLDASSYFDHFKISPKGKNTQSVVSAKLQKRAGWVCLQTLKKWKEGRIAPFARSQPGRKTMGMSGEEN